MFTKLRPALTVMFALAMCSGAFATVTVVAPSGNCSADFVNIQSAINSSATGDTVQLTGGSFDLSCIGVTGDSLVIPIWHGAITLAGTMLNGLPQTTLSGPGATDPSESTALMVQASGSTVTGLTLRGFYTGVHVRGSGNQGILVNNCRFEQNIVGVGIDRQSVGTQIVSNAFLVPSAPGAPYTDFDTTFGVLAGRQNSNLLITNNTFNGPGVNANFQKSADLMNAGALEDLGIRSVGIYQLDGLAASQFGRVSNNTISGFDMAIHASSDFSVISNNTVTSSALGIVLSNGAHDGVTQVTDGIVTENVATGNQFGLVLFSAARNVISLNDFTNSSVVGMLFQNNLGGADSEQNRFVLDQGSKAGVAGNQGGFLTWSGTGSQP